TAVVGMDLTQLLAGRVDSGELAAVEIEKLMGIVVDSFARGLAAEGMEVRRHDLELAVDVSLVVRCAFTALPVERLAGLAMLPDADRIVRHRAEWCRFLVDRGNRLLGEVRAAPA